jgi:hypothetical protein
MATLYKYQYTFMIISRLILLRMRNAVDKFVEKTKHNFYVQLSVFRKSQRLWDYVEIYGRDRQATDGNTIWCVRVACWITKVIDT